MLNLIKFYQQLSTLVPSYEHGLQMAEILRNLLHELIKDGREKDTLYFISKREVIIREALKDYYNSNLTDHQLRIFQEIQADVLKFLQKPENHLP